MPTRSSLFFQIRSCESTHHAWSRLCLAISAGMLVVMLLLLKDNAATWACAGFNLAVLGMRYAARKSTDPYVLIFLAFSLLFIEVPIAFIAVRWPDYLPSTGLSFDLTPPSARTAAGALGFLLLFYAAFFVAVRLVPLARHATTYLPRRVTLAQVLPPAALMLAFSFAYDNMLSASLTLARPGVLIEVLKFLCYDAAIFFFLFLVLVSDRRTTEGRLGRVGMFYYGLAAAFFLMHTVNSSKGAILVLWTLAFVFPLAIATQIRGARMIVPRLWVLIGVAACTPLVFIGAQVFRHIRRAAAMEGVQLSITDAFARLHVDGGVLQDGGAELFLTIGDRLSSVFNRYMVLYTSFDPFEDWGAMDSSEFPTYLGKSFLNLHLPGTPYPEAYFPSSMMFERLVQGKELLSGDLVSLQTSLNSQPYSGFGVLLLVAGLLAPIAFMVLIIALRLLHRAGGFYAAVLSIMLFYGFLSCYGAEAVFQVALSVPCTIALLVLLTRMLGRRGVSAAAPVPA